MTDDDARQIYREGLDGRSSAPRNASGYLIAS
jgi:hypothetical protein